MSLISVIIPLYNKEKSIADSMRSVLNQTFKDFELIIVNDGSIDKSLDVVKSFKDERIRVIDKENEGVSRTRNRGVEEAKSELIAFLDADDIMYPNCLKNLVDCRRAYPNCDMWVGKFCFVFNGKVVRSFGRLADGYVKNPHKEWFYENWQVRTGNFIMSRNTFLGLGGFPINVTVGEDFLFFDEFLNSYKCAFTSKPTMEYVQETRTLSTGGRPIEVTAEYNFDFKRKKFWQRMLYALIIIKHLISEVFNNHSKMILPFLKKYKLWCLFGVFALFVNTPVLFRKLRHGWIVLKISRIHKW